MYYSEIQNTPVGGINWGMKPTDGDIFGPRQRYLRTKTEISLDKSGDIRPQSRTMDRQIKYILVIIPPTGKIHKFSPAKFTSKHIRRLPNPKMRSLYEQASMAKYYWILCHLSLLLCRLKHSILVKASLECGHFRFICMHFLCYGGLFEKVKFDGSQLPQKH